MKKTIATLAMALTLAATVFAGASAPVSAMSLDQAGTYDHGEFYYDADLANSTSDENTIDYTNYNKDNRRTAMVTGTKHYLPLRSEPVISDDNVIGPLFNGNVVEVIGHQDGNFIKVYSPDYDCSGWVNANYLK